MGSAAAARRALSSSSRYALTAAMMAAITPLLLSNPVTICPVTIWLLPGYRSGGVCRFRIPFGVWHVRLWTTLEPLPVLCVAVPQEVRFRPNARGAGAGGPGL